MQFKNDDTNITDGEKENKSVVHRSDLLEVERNILQFDIEIKTSLQLTAADPAKCIVTLEKYKSNFWIEWIFLMVIDIYIMCVCLFAEEKITALMLKKNPNVVETIKRLRRYVGNIKDWNLTDEERIQFNENAEKVRQHADLLYNKFKVFFYSS